MQLLAWVLVGLMITSGAMAQERDEFESLIQNLEFMVQRPLTTHERKILFDESQAWLPSSVNLVSFNPHSGSNFLLCARMEAELYIGSAIAGCLDPSFNRYYLISGGVGFEAGISVSAFTLIYMSNTGAGVEGTYVGGKMGGAMGRFGGALGLYLKTSEVEIEGQKSDKLIWLGYVAGANIDISASALKIGQIQ